MEKLPEWFLTVPVFESTDPVFCLATYFLFYDDDDDDSFGGFETKKYSADWVENNDLEFIQWHEDWQIYDWDEEKVMICRHEQAYETNLIGVHLMNIGSARWETEDVAVDIAQKFIDALASVQPSPGQLQLELTLCTH